MRDRIKKMDLKKKDHKFLSEDSIIVIDFLARFVREANNQEISGAQAFVTLPKVITRFPTSQYVAAVLKVAPEDDGILSWPETIQYLLRNNAQSSHNSNAIRDLQGMSQKTFKTELEFYTWFNKAACRCGNENKPVETITTFIDELNLTILSIVTRFREIDQNVISLNVINFS